MTEEEAIKKMEKWVGDADTEVAHGMADDILCEFLTAKGYGGLVDVYRKVDKWFA